VSSDEREDWRRQAAIAAFDQTWELIDQPVRSTQDEAAMVLAAGASRYLWDGIGGEKQLAIGDWQVAHGASLLGDGDPALRFAASAFGPSRGQRVDRLALGVGARGYGPGERSPW
jgi:hypothetical protein